MFILLNILTSLFLTQVADSPNNSWPWILLILLVLLVAIFWWASGRSKLDEEEDVVEEATPLPIPDDQPESEEVVADDLEKIEGIGPKIASILNEAGIHTFEELASIDLEKLDQIVKEDADLSLATTETWGDQAKLAAAGDWEGLQTLQDDLIAGRDD